MFDGGVKAVHTAMEEATEELPFASKFFTNSSQLHFQVPGSDKFTHESSLDVSESLTRCSVINDRCECTWQAVIVQGGEYDSQSESESSDGDSL